MACWQMKAAFVHGMFLCLPVFSHWCVQQPGSCWHLTSMNAPVPGNWYVIHLDSVLAFISVSLHLWFELLTWKWKALYCSYRASRQPWAHRQPADTALTLLLRWSSVLPRPAVQCLTLFSELCWTVKNLSCAIHPNDDGECFRLLQCGCSLCLKKKKVFWLLCLWGYNTGFDYFWWCRYP